MSAGRMDVDEKLTGAHEATLYNMNSGVSMWIVYVMI
jgi:hypothetical protein